MALLIDGYNLLHVTGIFGKGRGAPTLQRSRQAMLNFLANRIDEEDLGDTTIVFDAKDAPPGLPRTLKHHGMTIHYAAHHDEADDLIEELIRASSAPRQLTVVSSDHRIQRAARRRKANAVDSEVWLDDLTKPREANEPQTGASSKPTPRLDESDVQAWVKQFSDVELELDLPPDVSNTTTEEQTPPSKEDEVLSDDLSNPFPPGYGEDLLDDLNP